jgi:hypothetical protein
LVRNDWPVLRLWFKEHLAAAFDLGKRPWESVPRYTNKVQLEWNSLMVSQFVEDRLRIYPYSNPNPPIAFDYETTCLKPEGSEAEIVSASIAWNSYKGPTAMSFSWQGEAIPAMKKLLDSNVPKIAHNMKFEERWTQKEFGHGVKNWKWDTMQAAHILDNRRAITSLNFQSFVKLGQEPYDSSIKPFLQSAGPGKPNRIKEIPINELLMYGGMDALLTYMLAEKQVKEMGIWNA